MHSGCETIATISVQVALCLAAKPAWQAPGQHLA
jgi:hypothetical protein